MKPGSTVEWLSKAEAATELGKSERRISQMGQVGQIKTKRERAAESGQTVVLFHAGDIARLRDQQENGTPRLRPAAESTAVVVSTTEKSIELMKRHGNGNAPPAAAWLTLDQAAEYSGLPASFIKRLLDTHKLLGLDTGPRVGGRWRIHKRDLDDIKGIPGGWQPE